MIPKTWRQRFDLLPGYDPVATAGDGHRFDVAEAERALRFFGVCLRHVKGTEAGRPFVLEAWQEAIVGCLFGWLREDDTRRYRETLVYVARGNGKTTLVAGILLYGLFCDHEPGAEIYGAASTYEQACLVFQQAVGMIRQDTDLYNRCRIFDGHGQAKAITVEDTFSAYKPVAADGTKQSGYNPHMWVIDELHEQPNSELIDRFRTGTVKRRQPLGVTLSTADYDRPSVCNEQLDYARNVRDGAVVDPAFLPALWESPAKADWTSPDTWRLANPNLGVSVGMEHLESQCQRAQKILRLQNTFRRFHLNQVTEQLSRWFAMDDWHACRVEIDEEALLGRKCCSGIDLSITGDMTAIVLAFPEEDGGIILLPYFFLPQDGIYDKGLRDKVDYRSWAQAGHLTLTPGRVIDHDFVEDTLVGLAQRFQIVEHAYDRCLAGPFSQGLQKRGYTVLEFNQGFFNFNEPSQQFERLILSHTLRHAGHPVLDWQASNVCVAYDASKTLIRPVKSAKGSGKKVDGIIAAVMAVARARAIPDTASIYETEELVVF